MARTEGKFTLVKCPKTMCPANTSTTTSLDNQ
jgi:hypothetical protein